MTLMNLCDFRETRAAKTKQKQRQVQCAICSLNNRIFLSCTVSKIQICARCARANIRKFRIETSELFEFARTQLTTDY